MNSQVDKLLNKLLKQNIITWNYYCIALVALQACFVCLCTCQEQMMLWWMAEEKAIKVIFVKTEDIKVALFFTP